MKEEEEGGVHEEFKRMLVGGKNTGYGGFQLTRDRLDPGTGKGQSG